MLKQGFDNRIVSYEYIHSITPADFSKLIDAIDPKSGDYILDAMCGYGAVSKTVLERTPEAKIYLLDESEVQLERARKNIPQVDQENFVLESSPHNGFANQYFDKIVIKMGLHEVSLLKHLAILKEFYRILKNTGKLVVWDVMLNNETQILFQDIIRKKDELSGFTVLTRDRYFFREEEFIENAKKAGFKTITEFHPISYRFSSKKRLEFELGGDIKKLKQLNDFIRGKFPDSLKQKLLYEDFGDDIQFTLTNKIFTLSK